MSTQATTPLPQTQSITTDLYVAAIVGAAEANLLLGHTSETPSLTTVENALGQDIAAKRLTPASAAVLQSYFGTTLCAVAISDAIIVARMFVTYTQQHPASGSSTTVTTRSPTAGSGIGLPAPVRVLGRSSGFSEKDVPRKPSPNLTPAQVGAAANAANAVLYPFNDKPLEDDAIGNALPGLIFGGIYAGFKGGLHFLKDVIAEGIIYLAEHKSTLQPLFDIAKIGASAGLSLSGTGLPPSGSGNSGIDPAGGTYPQGGNSGGGGGNPGTGGGGNPGTGGGGDDRTNAGAGGDGSSQRDTGVDGTKAP